MEGLRFTGPENNDVSGIKYDSRKVASGDLFAAVKGERFDGADFVHQAREMGAMSFLLGSEVPNLDGCSVVISENVRRSLALASRNFYGDPSSRLKVVGITGTNGKTTTAYLAHGILEKAGLGTGLIGTVQYLVGGQVISASRTTPESPDLNAMLSAMEKGKTEACIVEVSSHALCLERVTGIHMEAAVFTNLTSDHMDFHQDMEDYFEAKARLFNRDVAANCLINVDDPYGRRLLKKTGSETLTFGMKEGDIRPEGKMEWGEWGSRLSLATPWGAVPVDSPLPGLFNISNIMAAAGICGLMGLSANAIAEGISEVRKVPGRFERVDRGQAFTALVDYAHTPDALENLLANVREMADNRVILVFGCGGDRDRAKRPVMGKIAEQLADTVYVTSDNPRSEDPEKIIDDIFQGISSTGPTIRRVPDRREAIAASALEAEPGDVLVIAGKGHENYQITGNRTLPFSDADELAKVLSRLGEAEL